MASVSRLMCLVDPLLQFHVLKVLRSAFTPKTGDLAHCYYSPVLTSNDILAKYPPVLLICGSLDPLLDDSVFLARRLDKGGVKNDLHVFDGLSHGFMHFTRFDTISKEANQKVIDWIRN